MTHHTKTALALALALGLTACATTPPPAEDNAEKNVEEDAKSGADVPSADVEGRDLARDDGPPPGIADPDGVDTATSPPTASDLERYTADLGSRGRLLATFDTTMGFITCELYEDSSPLTVANFVGLARGLKAWIDPASGAPQVGRPLYDGVVFHRVIPKFMIQTGDPLGTGTGGPGYQIPDEFAPGRRHDAPGILSMANAGPGTGGSQFFITEVPTPHLDGKHTVFGMCDSPELVQKIANSGNSSVTIKKIDFVRAQF